MKKLFLKNWRDIRTRKAQFVALIILVALGITSYVAFVSSYRNLSASADHTSNELLLADFTSRVESAPRRLADDIAAVPGVAAVQGRMVIDTGLDLDEQTQVTARVVGVPADRHPSVNDIYVDEGTYLEPGVLDTVILHKKFARDAGIGVGDTLQLRVEGELREVKVVGIGTSADYVWPIRAKGEVTAPREFAVIFMAQEEVESLFGSEPSYNDFSVLLGEDASRRDVIDEVEELLEPYQLEETVKQEDLPSNFALREEIRQNESLAYSMPLLILVISSLSLFIALSRLVQSQRGQIGLAKALGYGNGSVLLHYLVFSLVIAVAGAAAGFGLGQFFGREITRLYNDFLNIPFLEHRVYGSVVAWSFAISLVSCVLAGIIPAWASVRMTPANAMRIDPNLALTRGRIPLVERALSRVMPGTFTFRIPLRNIFRTWKRSAYTVVGIVFALVLMISTWSLFDSIDYLIDNKFNQSERWDAMAIFREPLSPGQFEEISGWEEVSRAQGSQFIPARIELDGRTHEDLIMAVAPDADFHSFDVAAGESGSEALAAGGIVLPETLAEKLDAEVGDRLLVRTPYQREGREVELRTISDEVWGTSIFISSATGKELTPGAPPGYNGVYLNVEAGSGPDVRKHLYDMPGAEIVILKQSLMAAIESQMGFLYLFGGVMLAFAFTMAFVVIYNTFSANIMERTREIATMRTIGEDRRHLAAMITLENLLLAIVGIPLGVAAGLWAANLLYDSLSTEAYSIKAVLFPSSYVWIILSILGVLLVSEIPSIRRAFKLDLAEATKFLE